MSKTAATPNLSAEVDFESESKPTAKDVLAVLADNSAGQTDRRQAVLHAEVLTFDAAELPTLKQHLLQFIEAHRDSNDPEDQVAVASAIRKVIAEASADDLNAFALLLEPSGRWALPLELELEVSKMIVRKLTANPSIGSKFEPALINQLREIAVSYLNDRLLSRDKYPAVLANVILSLALLDSPLAKPFADRIARLRSEWFKTMLQRRATKIAEEVRQRDANAADRLIEFGESAAPISEREEADARIPAEHA